MSFVALDLNATELRAVRGTSRGGTQTIPLERERTALPMALSLEGRTLPVGEAGRALCRRSPHLACVSFLPCLGSSKLWVGTKKKITADQAMGLVLDHVRARAGRPKGVVLVLPSYLSDTQIESILHLSGKAKLHPLGSLERPLAATLAAHREKPFDGLSLVVDVDEHALTITAVRVEDGEAHLGECFPHPDLAERIWKERLLGLVADRCVRQSRRDPRHSDEAEQSLYDQLDEALHACQEGRHTEIALSTSTWYQNVLLAPELSMKACGRLVARVVSEVHTALSDLEADWPLQSLTLTASAARLPGLQPALEKLVAEWSQETDFDEEDFGHELLEEARLHLQVLAPDALAEVGHELALRFARGVLRTGHLEVAPLLDARPMDDGPARLEFRGEEYSLGPGPFTLGRASDSSLVFESEQFPSVSTHHCEIYLDQSSYALRDVSRYGTLINERLVDQTAPLHPGDWIRLGPGGPLLRFLGRGQQQHRVAGA